MDSFNNINSSFVMDLSDGMWMPFLEQTTIPLVVGVLTSAFGSVHFAIAFSKSTRSLKPGSHLVVLLNTRVSLQLSTTWRATLRRAGVPHFPIYNLRHPFCTRLSWVAPDAVIERAMRHSSPETKRIYQLSMVEQVREA